MYVTSKPTGQPIVSPTTSMPSVGPSRTGLVASIEVTATVVESLNPSDIAEIEAEVISSFNITADDLTTSGNFFHDFVFQNAFESACIML